MPFFKATGMTSYSETRYAEDCCDGITCLLVDGRGVVAEQPDGSRCPKLWKRRTQGPLACGTKHPDMFGKLAAETPQDSFPYPAWSFVVVDRVSGKMFRALSETVQVAYKVLGHTLLAA